MKLKEKHFILFFLIGLFVLFGVLVLQSDAAYGGADNYSHFRISKYAVKYPHLFLDHWGKPLFTILSSPFAQFGFKGIQLFNVILGLLTALFAYLALKKLEFKNAWLIIFFICFTPIYFIIMPSGLTEILFSFILVFSIYLFFIRRYIAASVIVSFILFSRTEGFIFIPLFLAAFVIARQYKAIPFLLSGFLFFSLIGYFMLDDFWWFFTQNPYTGKSGVYGSGELAHFLNHTKNINGIPLAVALFLGIISYVIDIFQNKKQPNAYYSEILLILGGYFLYFAAHSIVWWKGTGGSAGLIRVMAAVMPLAAIVSLRGFNLVYQWLKFNQFVQYAVLLIFLFFVIRTPFQIFDVPVERDSREKVLFEAAEWLRTTDYYQQKIYYYDTYFCYKLAIDPFDKGRCHERIPSTENPAIDIPPGSIVQWDAHFGPERNLPLNTLQNSPEFKQLKVFRPVSGFKSYTGHDYAVFIFQKTE
ncbi:MAG TPA: hypothetical protein VJ896_11500 [Bacteroidales bacterium]|nr:hypothetical protein [Bacteroidales bacterium]